MKRKITIVLFFSVAALLARAQKRADTAAVIKEFDKVMAFAVQPYSYYTSTTSVYSEPASRLANNGVLHNTFYKVNDDLYYGNEQEEIFVQDSLFVRINHLRKSILISKLDIASKQNMDVLPLKKLDVQKMLREHYYISQEPGQDDTERIIIRSQPNTNAAATSTMEMQVVYLNKVYLPAIMKVSVYMQQLASAQAIAMLARQGFEAQSIVQQKDNRQYIVLKQTTAVQFANVGAAKEKAMQMPHWQEKIAYDNAGQLFAGKGTCEGYEVTKTF